jgi:hypothetical protein
MSKKTNGIIFLFKPNDYFCVVIITEPNNSMDISLSEETKTSLKRTTGISYDEILLIDADEQTKRIEEKIGRKLQFSPVKDVRFRFLMRGSILLYLNRFFVFDSKKMDKQIESILKKHKKNNQKWTAI